MNTRFRNMKLKPAKTKPLRRRRDKTTWPKWVHTVDMILDITWKVWFGATCMVLLLGACEWLGFFGDTLR